MASPHPATPDHTDANAPAVTPASPQARILGVGSALPPTAADQPTLAHAAAPNNTATPREVRRLHALYQRTTVATRSSVLLSPDTPITKFYPPPSPATHPPTPPCVDDPASPTTAARMHAYRQHAGPLAARAAQHALTHANLPAQRITHLVTVSCTGFHNPGIDLELLQTLSLPDHTQRLHLGFMGCHGALAGLRTAAALAASTPAANVLLVCVELCTLHFQYGPQPDHLVANALFADAAAAVVLTTPSDTHPPSPRYTHAVTALVPDSREAMSWTITDHGFTMTLSPRVPDLVADHLPPLLDRLLTPHHLTIPDVAHWVIHPGGPRVIAAALRTLNLPGHAAELSRQILQQHGNVSSPTVLLILQRLFQQSPPPRGPVVMLAVGPGLSLEAALLQV